MNFRCKSERCP